MRYLIDVLYLVGLICYSPVLLWRVLVVGKDRRGWRQRLGGVPARTSDRPLIWIHAVSMGEANATRTLVDRLRAVAPDCEIAFSATTDTGSNRLAQLYPNALRFRYPWDFSCVVSRFFRRLRPALIVLMELEVWPNFMAEASRRGVPVVVANGRLTARSFPWYRRMGWITRPMFRRLAGVAAQDHVYAERFAALGVDPARVRTIGSMKYDTAGVEDRVEGQDDLARAMGLGTLHRLMVGGSTAEGEERALLDAYRDLLPRWPTLRLAIIPRSPQRFDEVAALIERGGFTCWRRSRNVASRSAVSTAQSPPVLDAKTVVLGDTMGELRKFYALGEVAFVGRSLVPLGGSDFIEAAALGKPVIVGPNTQNFEEPTSRLRAVDGICVVPNAAALAGALERLLADDVLRQRTATAGRAAVVAAKGGTAKIADFVLELLKK